MIVLADINRLFRSDEVETTALRSIDLTIEEGEFVAIETVGSTGKGDVHDGCGGCRPRGGHAGLAPS